MVDQRGEKSNRACLFLVERDAGMEPSPCVTEPGARQVEPGHGQSPVTADACARGTAGLLVLVLYDRIPIDSLQLDGDPRLFYQLSAWDPDA
jgi:hypothetical protein